MSEAACIFFVVVVLFMIAIFPIIKIRSAQRKREQKNRLIDEIKARRRRD